MPAKPQKEVLLLNSTEVPGHQTQQILGLVQGPYCICYLARQRPLRHRQTHPWRRALTEYTDMMARARTTATNRMMTQAAEMGADAIINIRYMTTSVVGSAAELFAYGTAVKLTE